MRPEQPFRKVVTIENGKYSLPSDHAQRALQHLLYSVPVHVAELAALLYRDFGLLGDQPTIQELIDVFAFEFGYINNDGDEPDTNFTTLFSLKSVATWETEWLEVI